MFNFSWFFAFRSKISWFQYAWQVAYVTLWKLISEVFWSAESESGVRFAQKSLLLMLQTIRSSMMFVWQYLENLNRCHQSDFRFGLRDPKYYKYKFSFGVVFMLNDKFFFFKISWNFREISNFMSTGPDSQNWTPDSS